ncbi:MAG: hypothetical protein JXA94_02210 [Parachlamydiales bacterium]|nr:hypothetical protein [Parachlamydiales bacterium]
MLKDKDKQKSLITFFKKNVLLVLSSVIILTGFKGPIKEFSYIPQKITKRAQNEQNRPIEVLLLLALPAAGKSEIRNYLSSISLEERINNFNVSEMVELDDFPYVFFMRRISEELETMGMDPIYYQSKALPLTEPNDWKTLIHLINEDYEDIINQYEPKPGSAAMYLFDRLDRARAKVGLTPSLSRLPNLTKVQLAEILEKEAQKILDEKNSQTRKGHQNKTVVIEFSRGGAKGSTFPLPSPYGYENSLNELSDEILQKAHILYLDVSEEESLKRNEQRFDPNDPGSSLHHYVPEVVMIKDYGVDDMKYLAEKSKNLNNHIKVTKNKHSFYLPISILDNRSDKTSTFRKESNEWNETEKKLFEKTLKNAFDTLKK